VSSISDVIAAAKFRADLQDSHRVLQGEWAQLYRDAAESAWALCSAARPDFQVLFADYTVASSYSASIVIPPDFHDIIDVVCSPDTQQEYSLGPFNWFNRRSPGGWLWQAVSPFGGVVGATNARLMSPNIFLEPGIRAGGTYRLWYCPRVHVPRQIVRLATVAPLPACVAAGSGVGKTLTASGNGALSVDGAAVAAGDKLLVKDQVTTGNDGVYTVVQPGTAGTPFILIRTPGYDTTATYAGGMMLGDIVAVGQTDAAQAVGTQEGKFFTLTTLTAIEAAQAWTEGAAVDYVLEKWLEVLYLKTAIPAILRDNRQETASGFMKRLDGPDGKSGIEGDMKQYFATTRQPGPERMRESQSLTGGWYGNGGW